MEKLNSSRMEIDQMWSAILLFPDAEVYFLLAHWFRSHCTSHSLVYRCVSSLHETGDRAIAMRLSRLFSCIIARIGYNERGMKGEDELEEVSGSVSS